MSDGTFEAKKDQPKIGIWTLKMLVYFPDLSQAFQSHLENRFQSEGKRIKIEKTIRLRWHHIEDWIGDTNIKVKQEAFSYVMSIFLLISRPPCPHLTMNS